MIRVRVWCGCRILDWWDLDRVYFLLCLCIVCDWWGWLTSGWLSEGLCWIYWVWVFFYRWWFWWWLMIWVWGVVGGFCGFVVFVVWFRSFVDLVCGLWCCCFGVVCGFGIVFGSNLLWCLIDCGSYLWFRVLVGRVGGCLVLIVWLFVVLSWDEIWLLMWCCYCCRCLVSFGRLCNCRVLNGWDCCVWWNSVVHGFLGWSCGSSCGSCCWVWWEWLCDGVGCCGILYWYVCVWGCWVDCAMDK